MQGYDALWMPGTDHAGIATQIEDRGEPPQGGGPDHVSDLGREEFLKRVWDVEATSTAAASSAS